MMMTIEQLHENLDGAYFEKSIDADYSVLEEAVAIYCDSAIDYLNETHQENKIDQYYVMSASDWSNLLDVENDSNDDRILDVVASCDGILM